MTDNHRYNHFVFFALILIVGLGFALTLPWLANAQSNAPEALTRYYVARTGDGSNGSSWEKAYKNVQVAMIIAAVNGGGEIWVAKGVYYPDEAFYPDNSQEATFPLHNNIVLYGGFDTDDTKLSDRDWVNNLTVLSGDIDKNDNTNADGVVIDTDNINGDNAYHVVTGINGNITGILDGFTITAGHASKRGGTTDIGGGFLCDGEGIDNVCNPILRNIKFSGNLAAYEGGAMNNNGSYKGTSSPSLTNVTFYANRAEARGGAMYNNGMESGTSSPSLTNVIFSNNSAGDSGAAMYNDGMYKGTSSPHLINVVFSGNSTGGGGAMVNHGGLGESQPLLDNVTFSGNTAGFFGGAVYNIGTGGTSSPVLRNCILWNNRDKSGTATLSSAIENENGSVTLKHSLTQGAGSSGSNWTSDPSYVDGGGNIDIDPMFVTPVDPATAPTEDGDLRLTINSPAIDAGNNDFIDVSFDLDNKPRKVDGDLDGPPTVDMGAYEYQIEYAYGGYLPLIFR